MRTVTSASLGFASLARHAGGSSATRSGILPRSCLAYEPRRLGSATGKTPPRVRPRRDRGRCRPRVGEHRCRYRRGGADVDARHPEFGDHGDHARQASPVGDPIPEMPTATCVTLDAARAACCTQPATTLIRTDSAIGWDLIRKDTPMELGLWTTAIALALASAGASGWMVRRSMLRSFDERRKRIVAAANEQHASIIAKLRAAHMSATRELEQMHASVRDQVAAAVSAEKAASARLESRLTLAYEELDRLRQQANRQGSGGEARLGPGLCPNRGDGISVNCPDRPAARQADPAPNGRRSSRVPGP